MINPTIQAIRIAHIAVDIPMSMEDLDPGLYPDLVTADSGPVPAPNPGQALRLVITITLLQQLAVMRWFTTPCISSSITTLRCPTYQSKIQRTDNPRSNTIKDQLLLKTRNRLIYSNI